MDAFLGEIRIFAGNFAPKGWAFCNGQLMPITQNTALFSLLGTTYGGDGKTTFALPNLMGRAPMHPGQGPGLTSRHLGEMIGSSAETLLWSEMPSHNHAASWGSTAERTDSPVGAIWTNTAGRRGGFAYTDYAPGTVEPMNAQEAGAAGGGQPHNNMQPFLALNFIIALEGIFPPRG